MPESACHPVSAEPPEVKQGARATGIQMSGPQHLILPCQVGLNC